MKKLLRLAVCTSFSTPCLAYTIFSSSSHVPLTSSLAGSPSLTLFDSLASSSSSSSSSSSPTDSASRSDSLSSSFASSYSAPSYSPNVQPYRYLMPLSSAAGPAGVHDQTVASYDFDAHYHVTLTIGSAQTPFEFILDTGTYDLVLFSPNSSIPNLCQPSGPFVSSSPLPSPSLLPSAPICFASSSSSSFSLSPAPAYYSSLEAFLSYTDDNESYQTASPVRYASDTVGATIMQVAVLPLPTTMPTMATMTMATMGTKNPTVTNVQLTMSLTMANPMVLPYSSTSGSGVNYTAPQINTLRGVAGIAGFSSLMSLLSSTNLFSSSIVALEFRDPLNSFMHLGGIDDAYYNSMVWSPYSSPNVYSFSLFDLSVCGVSLYASVGVTSLLSIVDTGSTCLSLPAELFDALMTWLPVTCTPQQQQVGGGMAYQNNQDTFGVQGGPITCTLNDGTVNDLPTLQFALTNGGMPLYINISDLIVNTTSNPPVLNRLCIDRSASVYSGSNPNYSTFTVSFGSRVLRSLYTALSTSSGQVGFSNRGQLNQSNVQCKVPVVCKGMQTQSVSANLCIEPPCADYFFFDFDPVNRVCVLSLTFHMTAATIISLFIVTEVLLNEYVTNLYKQVATHIPLS